MVTNHTESSWHLNETEARYCTLKFLIGQNQSAAVRMLFKKIVKIQILFQLIKFAISKKNKYLTLSCAIFKLLC